jgi:hypothetical protein
MSSLHAPSSNRLAPHSSIALQRNPGFIPAIIVFINSFAIG